MTDIKARLISYITDDNIDKLEYMYSTHKELFGNFLFKYAVRNNSLKCLDFLVKRGYFKVDLSHKCVRSTNGDFISIETFKYLKTIPGFDYKVEGESILVKIIHCRKIHLLSEYVHFLIEDFPDIIDFIKIKFKRYWIKESDQQVFLRDIIIYDILQ